MPEPARIVDLADGIAGFIRQTWAPTGLDAVTRTWLVRAFFAEDDPYTLHRGRQVYVMPAEHRLVALTRGGWRNAYGVMVVLIERYEDAGHAPDEWVAERTLFWEQKILFPLCNPEIAYPGTGPDGGIDGPAGVVTGVLPDPEQPPEVAVFVDRDRLVRNKAVLIAATFFYIDGSDFTGAG